MTRAAVAPAQVVSGARTLKVETEGSGASLAVVGVHFNVKGPDGHVHQGTRPEPCAHDPGFKRSVRWFPVPSQSHASLDGGMGGSVLLDTILLCNTWESGSLHVA